MTQDQMEFAKRHGITRVPPKPTVEMRWHGKNDAQLTEAEMISECARYVPIIPAADYRPKGFRKSSFLRKGVRRHGRA